MRLVGVFGLAVLAFSASVFALPTIKSSKDLLTDMFEFIELVPFEEIEDVIKRWVDDDPNVRATFDFLQSDRYRELIDQEGQIPEFVKYLQFLEDSRAPAFDLWNFYRLMIGLDPMELKTVPRSAFKSMLVIAQNFVNLIKSYVVRSAKPGPAKKNDVDPTSALKMVDECMELLDKKKFEELNNRKLEESEDFKFFVDRMDTVEHVVIREALKNNLEFKKIVSEFMNNGYDMYGIFNKILRSFFPTGDF